jgi:Na+/H+-dicarboxylate symporter
MLKYIPKVMNSIIFKLLITLVFGFFFGNLLPTSIQSFFYAISLTLKATLIFFLPFIIFSCIFSCLLSFKSDVFKFIIILLTCICLSGYVSTFIGYNVSKFALSGFDKIQQTLVGNSANPLMPYWDFHFPTLISNNTALFSGFIAGLIFSKFKNKYVQSFANKMREIVTLFLNKVFVPVLPLFALGFIIKLESDGVLAVIIKSYFPLVIAIIITETLYISVLYFIGAGFSPKKFISYAKNVLPAGMMAFSSMSSMAALPLTIQAAEKNTGQIDLSRTIAPATVNVHLVGDSIAVPMIALAIMATFGLSFPDLLTFFIFASYFVIAKFAVAGIPGGGIVVMIPILEKHLGFSPEMAGLITAIYILLDPLNTTANVLGNGAFTILSAKLFKKKLV